MSALAERTTEAAGKVLVERLAIYPAYIAAPEKWLDASLRPQVLRACDAEGFARSDAWIAGPVNRFASLPSSGASGKSGSTVDERLRGILAQASAGETLAERDVVALFAARGDNFDRVCAAADGLRRKVNGDSVAYVVNRNINYTNVCYYRCQFCAFSKGRLSENLRGRPYDLPLSEIQRRCVEAWERGATEVCLQGGIHPDYTGATYLEICRAIKAATPDIHIHAFSPLEVFQGAQTLSVSVRAFLAELRAAGLGSLPGTAAESPGRRGARNYLPRQGDDRAMARHRRDGPCRRSAHHRHHHVRPCRSSTPLGAAPAAAARLAGRTGGLTEFVPLPYVPMETPIYLRGRARSGPTYREAVLMHAVARLALHPHVTNIQTSWVKMGPDGVKACLDAGANDVGGTLMNESITRAAGAVHGEELPPAEMEALIRSIGRKPVQRTTLYGDVPATRRDASFNAAPLTIPINHPAGAYERGVAAE